jgi:hypothetical protein
MTAVTDWDRIGQDLWPPHRRLLVRRALKAGTCPGPLGHDDAVILDSRRIPGPNRR